MLKEYKTVSEISGPLMMVEGVENAKFGHMVDIELGDGSMRHGQILQVQGDKVMVQVFEGTSGLTLPETRVRFIGRPLKLAVSPRPSMATCNGWSLVLASSRRRRSPWTSARACRRNGVATVTGQSAAPRQPASQRNR